MTTSRSRFAGEERRTVPKWLCDDGNCAIEIEAETAEDAAEEYVDGGDWDLSEGTIHVTVFVWQPGQTRRDASEHTITLDPPEPSCVPRSGQHDWRPRSVMGHGGGVLVNEFCSRCGGVKRTDTWAQNPRTGQQGLRSITYTR